jgi:hypothetical protein
MHEEKPTAALEGQRGRWLAMVDQDTRTRAAAALQARTFWEQPPSDIKEADNPSALLQSIVSRWL